MTEKNPRKTQNNHSCYTLPGFCYTLPGLIGIDFLGLLFRFIRNK
jgi:hypothetical protein